MKTKNIINLKNTFITEKKHEVYIFESNYFLTDKRHQKTGKNVIKSSQTIF